MADRNEDHFIDLVRGMLLGAGIKEEDPMFEQTLHAARLISRSEAAPGPNQQAMLEAIRIAEEFVGTARLSYTSASMANELEREDVFHALLHAMVDKGADMIEKVARVMPCQREHEHDVKPSGVPLN